MLANPARVLVISERGLRPIVPMSYFYEQEDVISSIDHVDLISPRRWDVSANSSPPFVHRIERWAGWKLTREAAVESISLKQDYDLLFVIGPFLLHPLRILQAVRGWQQRCRVKVLAVHEAWVNQLRSDSAWVRRQWEAFDHVLVGFPGTVGPASEFLGRHCPCLPGGVDALRFSPADGAPTRSVDVANIGRREESVHRAVLEWAARTHRWYEYDTTSGGTVKDHVAHRRRLAEQLQRTKYFVAHLARFNDRAQRGDQEEIGIRHFEGAAAGAVLIGQPPQSLSRSRFFDWPDAIIPVPFDSLEIIDVIEQLDRDPDRVERISRENSRQILLRHDWSYGWRRVLELAGLEPTPAHLAREAELRQRAEQLVASASTE